MSESISITRQDLNDAVEFWENDLDERGPDPDPEACSVNYLWAVLLKLEGEKGLEVPLPPSLGD